MISYGKHMKSLQKKYFGSHMFYGLSSNSRHFRCRGLWHLYHTLLERQYRGKSVLIFPSNSVCDTETLSDSSNNHYWLNHLQDSLDILGLPEMESLKAALGLFKYVNSVSSKYTEGQCRGEGGKHPLSHHCSRYRKGNLSHPAFTV